MGLRDKQRGVLRGMLVALAISLAGLVAGIAALPAPLAADAMTGDRLAYALRSDALVVFWLGAGIARLAAHRFFTPEDIDGGGLTEGTQRAHMLQAILQNTLEQTALAIPVHLMWSLVMPIGWIGAVPAAAIMFFVGRLLFIRGYADGAPARALGFALTFYPTQLMLIAVLLTSLAALVR